jgi:hypothetical protein
MHKGYLAGACVLDILSSFLSILKEAPLPSPCHPAYPPFKVSKRRWGGEGMVEKVGWRRMDRRKGARENGGPLCGAECFPINYSSPYSA